MASPPRARASRGPSRASCVRGEGWTCGAAPLLPKLAPDLLLSCPSAQAGQNPAQLAAGAGGSEAARYCSGTPVGQLCRRFGEFDGRILSCSGVAPGRAKAPSIPRNIASCPPIGQKAPAASAGPADSFVPARRCQSRPLPTGSREIGPGREVARCRDPVQGRAADRDWRSSFRVIVAQFAGRGAPSSRDPLAPRSLAVTRRPWPGQIGHHADRGRAGSPAAVSRTCPLVVPCSHHDVAIGKPRRERLRSRARRPAVCAARFRRCRH